ncbi:MAG: hypothetical protein KGL04_08440 [Elusimicrobia bacterium]|nr:hypothetical protein [Elusimicrobiota bacterium]MDE2314187.1 hypothetical protein [Elusimicrobiota bacterium]
MRSNDGYRAIDREKFLNGTWTFGGSYTIPNGLMLLGENSISLVLHAAGQRAPYDVVRVNFWAWQRRARPGKRGAGWSCRVT